MSRDTSRDGLKNRLEFYALSHFGPLWRMAQRIAPVERTVNRLLINRAVMKVRTRIPPPTLRFKRRSRTS